MYCSSEVPYSVASTHIRQLTITCDSRAQRSKTLFWPMRALHLYVRSHPAQTHTIKTILKNTLFKGCQRCIPKKNASFTYHEVTKYSIQKIFLGHSKTKYNMDISLVQQDNPCICYTEISCKKQICLHMCFYRRGIESKLSENLQFKFCNTFSNFSILQK